MIDISAGGFSSLACSSFGDLYGWGWNSHGELGIKTGKNHLSCTKIATEQSVFVNPQIIELDCDEDYISEVSSGVNHSIITTKGGKYFCSGSNEFGQLGIKKDTKLFKCNKIRDDIYIDCFTELKSEHLKDSSEIFCNSWSTIIINKRN